jgi:hypothetical protein
VFSSASVFASVLLIWSHLRNWTVPEHQTHIVRILIMVPIYAVDSWLSLRFREYSLYFDIARDCYEAYVLHQFFSLLVAYIETGKEPGYNETILETKPKQKHPFPCCCLPRFKPGKKAATFVPTSLGPLFMLITRQCILQYVVIRPLMAIIASILQHEELYFEGSFLPTYFPIIFLNSHFEAWIPLVCTCCQYLCDCIYVFSVIILFCYGEAARTLFSCCKSYERESGVVLFVLVR